jgi:hypothetical protein
MPSDCPKRLRAHALGASAARGIIPNPSHMRRLWLLCYVPLLHATLLCPPRWGYHPQDHSGAQKGLQHGKGQTSSAEAGAPCPMLRLVHPLSARRRRHGDLPGQGAGHVPCRVSGPVSRRDVAMGGALGTTACAANHDACPQLCAGLWAWGASPGVRPVSFQGTPPQRRCL